MKSSNRATVPRRSTVYVLAAGFLALLLLLVLLTVAGSRNMRLAQERLDEVVRVHIAKIRLVTGLRTASRERTVALQKMLLTTDLFERDDLWLRFTHQGGEFARLRGELLTLPLGAREHELLKRQGEFARVSIPLQHDVINLLADGKQAAARRVLNEQAVPAQERVYGALEELHDNLVREAERASVYAARDYERARDWVVSLFVITGISALGIALVVFRVVRRSEADLRHEKERAQVTLHSIGEAVVRADTEGRIEYLNPFAARLTGWVPEEAEGRALPEVLRILHDASREPVPDPVRRAIEGGAAVKDSGDTVLVARDGREHAIELTAAPIRDGEGKASGAVLVFRDVTEMRALGRELVYEATHDPMTGLINRREFERRLQISLEEARAQDCDHALCYLDLDFFKTVNDTCGHLAGDELLKRLSFTLRHRGRREDVLARVGGDEFALLLKGCTLERAEAIAGELRAALRDFRFLWEDKSIEIGASIGVVRIGADSGDLNDVLRAADVACRVAKEDGRNCIHVFRPNDLTVVRRQREIDWARRLRRAAEEGGFVLYGQWLRPLATGSRLPALCEVLLRLEDGDGEVVPPAAFLPAAERYHLMPLVDRWVVRNVFRALARHVPAPGAAFCLNLSGQTLCDPEFLPFVQRELVESKVRPQCLCFEVTETAAITHMSRAVQFIGALRDAGCRFALDDFGSGLSSFNYLKSMIVDFLKIDGAFVRDALDDETDLAVVTSINQVAHIMGIHTIAECVESAAIREAMARVGVDYGQGYALAPVQPLEQILAGQIPAGEGAAQAAPHAG
jgi:diguanylate cyclase (GGDEF)-like protein/PAS domain S-box-containing protein